MRQESRVFADPATARAFIKYLATGFEDPMDLSAFVGLCDIAQAVLAYSIVAALCESLDEKLADTKGAISVELGGFCDGNKAAADLDMLKEEMKKVMMKLRFE